MKTIKRGLLDILAWCFLWLEHAARRGLVWCDEHYTADDIDELMAEIESAHLRLFAEPPRDVPINTVHLPRIPNRKPH